MKRERERGNRKKRMVPVNVRSKDASGGITVVKVVIAKIVVSPPGKSTKNGFSFHFFLFSDFYFLRVGVRKKKFFFFSFVRTAFRKQWGRSYLEEEAAKDGSIFCI